MTHSMSEMVKLWEIGKRVVVAQVLGLAWVPGGDGRSYKKQHRESYDGTVLYLGSSGDYMNLHSFKWSNNNKTGEI